MWPFLIGGALLAGAAYLLWRLLKNRRQNQPQSGQAAQDYYNQPSEGDANDANQEDQGEPEAPARDPVQERRNEQISEIVSQIPFSFKLNRVETEVPTGEMIESRLPTDDVDVVPVKSAEDLLGVSASTHALGDDQFFGRFAAGGLMRQAFMEPETRTEVELTPNAKALVVLADVSGSMAESFRGPWMLSLVRALVERSQKEQARFVLIPFNRFPLGLYTAKTEGEYRSLLQTLERKLAIGGDTDIDRALLEGIKYLKAQEFTDASIVLITDGENNVNINHIGEALSSAEAKLVTVAVATERKDLGEISERLFSVH